MMTPNYPSSKLNTREEVYQTPIMPNEYPFWVCQYGHTYADQNYHEASLNTQISRIEYVLSGRGIINSKNHSYIVTAGDTYILHQGDNHNYYSDVQNPMDKIWININGVLAKELMAIYKISDSILFKNANTYEFIQRIHKICKENSDPYVIQAKASATFCELVHFLSMQQLESKKKSDFLDDIRSYLDLHINENISIEDLCKISKKSANHTIHLFKERFGITPHQYILKLKLRIARTMLRSGDLSVEKIAEKVNFCNVGHFSDIFYKYNGMRPSEYRKSFLGSLSSQHEQNDTSGTNPDTNQD